MGFRRKYRKRFRKRYKKRGTSLGKKLMRDARKPGKNSLVERAVALIAKKEALKLMPPNLIYRQYFCAPYDSQTNAMGPMTRIGWDGLVISLCQIPKADNETQQIATSVPQVPDPNLFPQFAYPPGNVSVINTRAIGGDGFRLGNTVSVKSIALGIRVQNRPLGANNPDYEHSFLKWAVVTTAYDAQSGVGWEPTADRLLKMKIFGFSSRLDVAETQQITHLKTRTLMSGTIKCDFSQYYVVETQREYFKNVNVRIEYQPDDIYGQQVTGDKKLFLVLRSTIPQASQWQPVVGGYFKINYRNES